VFVDGETDPPLDSREVFVAGGQDIGGDQHAAQVLDRLAGSQLVEGGVGERPVSASQLGQGCSDGGAFEPVQRRRRPIGVGQCLMQCLQFGSDLSVGVGEQGLPIPPYRIAV